MKKLVLLFLLFLPVLARAQSYDEIRSSFPGAIITTITGDHGFIYDEPDLSAGVIGRYGKGREVLAYRKVGDFFAVATREDGHAGYVLMTQLDVEQEEGAAVARQLQREALNPTTALQMGMALPGGGHLYTGEINKGVGLLTTSVLGFVGGFALTERSRKLSCDSESLTCQEEKDMTWVIAGSAIAAAAWAYGILDAPRSARRHNARAGLTARVMPVAVPQPGLAVRVNW